jgi:hypothetical protein
LNGSLASMPSRLQLLKAQLLAIEVSEKLLWIVSGGGSRGTTLLCTV